jgi:small-conductance mechanosensitive channel
LVVAVLGAILIWLAARWLRGMVQGAMARRRINPEVVRVVSRVTFVAVVVVGLFVGAAVFGQGQLGASGVLAATILAALGIQDILRNYISGVYLLTERRLNVGDEIEFSGHVGTITEIRFRVTYLKGPQGELIIVPNSELFNSTVSVRANKLAAVELPKAAAGLPSRKRRA